MKGMATQGTALCFVAALMLAGCGDAPKEKDPAAEAPPPAQVVRESDASVVQVDKA